MRGIVAGWRGTSRLGNVAISRRWVRCVASTQLVGLSGTIPSQVCYGALEGARAVLKSAQPLIAGTTQVPPSNLLYRIVVQHQRPIRPTDSTSAMLLRHHRSQLVSSRLPSCPERRPSCFSDRCLTLGPTCEALGLLVLDSTTATAVGGKCGHVDQLSREIYQEFAPANPHNCVLYEAGAGAASLHPAALAGRRLRVIRPGWQPPFQNQVEDFRPEPEILPDVEMVQPTGRSCPPDTPRGAAQGTGEIDRFQ